MDASDGRFIKKCTSDSSSQWSPWSYCCPETSAKQETAKKPCCIRQGPQPDGRLDSSVEKYIFQMNHQLSSNPSAANIVDDPRFTQKTVKFGGGKIMVWFCIQHGGAREICKVDGNIDGAKFQKTLASQYIPNYKRGQILTGWSSLLYLMFHYEVYQGEKDQGPSGTANSLQIWILLSISGEEWIRTKSKNLEELWYAYKVAFHAIPDDFINRMATVLQAKGTHTRYYLLNV